MLKISITSTAVHTKSGIGKNGRPYEIREQSAWVHLYDQDGKANPFPTGMMLMLDKNAAPFAVGDYIMQLASIQSGSFGSLKIKPILHPVMATVSQNRAAS
jgi:hypothetical protein